MTRLANIEKAGYFPLPVPVTERIISHITAPHGGRLLDPCAGEGAALVALAAELGLEPYGVELHEGRAKTAKGRIADFGARSAERGVRNGENSSTPHSALATPHSILHDSYLNLRSPRGAYNLLYLNPPYLLDNEEEAMAGEAGLAGSNGRAEYQFLWRTRPYLQPDGLLVYVVPRHILRSRKLAGYLAAHFRDIQVYRFPDGEYEQFRQIALFGVHRRQAVTPDAAEVEHLRALGQGEALLTAVEPESLPCLEMPAYSLPAPVVKAGQFFFRSQFIDPAEALAEARQVGVCTKTGWREHLDPTAVGVPLRPLTPLKIGHMNSIIAAGHLNNQVLTDEETGERLLIKGRSYKVTRPEQYEEELPDGRIRLTKLETEQVVTDVTSIAADGQVTAYSGAALEQFLQRWIGALTGIIARDYPPVYQFDLNGYGRLLGSLSKGRLIPGLNGQTGLLPAQKHAAAAILTRLETYSEAICVGEMGTGKTTLAAAVAAGRHAQRTIVLCPPHLVDKWQREVKAVWPGARATHLQTISDVDQFFADQPDNAPLVGVLKQTTARSASGWEHAYNYSGPASHNYGSGEYTDVQRPWGEALVARPAQSEAERAAYRRPFTDRQMEAMRQRGVRCPVCGATQFISGRPLAVGEMKTATRRCSNEACRSPLYQFTRRRSPSQERGSFRLYADRERAILQAIASPSPAVPFSPSPRLPVPLSPTLRHGYGKVPLSGYIKKRARGKLDLLIVDECHQYKGIDSDQGYAMHHLAQAADKTVALTGTIYGGKASSLFYLLFRLAPEMRRAFVNPEASGQRRLRSKEWVSAYGILQQIETVTLDEDGKQTANSRANVRYKELPGGSPALLPWLLNRSVFLSLGDMGFPLPEYAEIPVSVPMAPEQAARYESLKEQLREELKERLVRGDKSLLAGYLYALLFWPDSPRRAKVVRCPRTDKIVASVPGLPDDFVGPKEEEIIALCRQEKAQNRKVLLLCQQTDTLDIQPEWQEMLAAAGLKAAILRAAPNKREGWVAKQVQAGVDVVISHPRKVETGIDLLDFPTIIWMAIDYSVYTVLQASRRSWRIGQTQPVKVYYFAYEETIQEDALRLVAAKVAATLRVNGETVGDDGLADLDEAASGDLVATLAKIVTGDVHIEAQNLQQAFAEANAGLRQANTMIGDYPELEGELEREEEERKEMEIEGEWMVERVALRPLPVPAGEGNGHGGARQPGLFGNGAVKANGHTPPATSSRPPAANGQPPVPRPRLLISQLGGRP